MKRVQPGANLDNLNNGCITGDEIIKLHMKKIELWKVRVHKLLFTI